MLRRAVLASALVLAVSACKKADSKEVGSSTAADSRVSAEQPPGSADIPSTTEGTGDVKGSAGAQVTPDQDAPELPRDKPGSRGTGKGAVETAEGGTKGSDSTAGDDSFSLTISAPDPVAAGAAATAKLTVKPGKGYHMNKDFPTKLTIEPPAGVTLAKTTFEGEDAVEFTDDHLVFEVDCTPGSTGTYTVSGKLKFAVCTESTCDPKRQAISFAVAAK